MKLKDEEKQFTTKYMEHKYQHSPIYKDCGYDIPDCYFVYCGENYAIEVTRYFQQNSEKEHQQYVRDVEKYFRSNFFEQAYHRLGKKISNDVTISFYDAEELKTLIISNIGYIKHISVSNNYYFNEKKDKLGDVFCVGNTNEKMSIIEFLDIVSEFIYEEKDVRLDIFTKNKYDILI